MIRTSHLLGALALSATLIAAPTAAFADVFVGAGIGIGIGISVNIAPPPIPVYVQPPVVVADTIWTPGYWAYGAYGYYWVPGTWVTPPQRGYLWTPGYWAFSGGSYGWHGGYWGPHVGFYGGVNYGFGYAGVGYVGGGWDGDHFRYNTAVTNVNTTTITSVYVNRTVVNNYTYNTTTIDRTSYNGGPGGVEARATSQELAYQGEAHLPPTVMQQQHITMAGQNRNYLANVNHGRPAEAAIAAPLSEQNRPANFTRPTAEDKVAAPSSDAFSRFNQERGTTGGTSPNAERPESTYHSADTYHASDTTRPADTYHASDAARPADTYHASDEARPADTYHAENTYHAAPASHPADTYHAPATYHSANTYHPATVSHPATTYHAAPAPKSEPHASDDHSHENN